MKNQPDEPGLGDPRITKSAAEEVIVPGAERSEAGDQVTGKVLPFLLSNESLALRDDTVMPKKRRYCEG